jgi:Fe2+ or Zn2+ uptake regulation protein
VKEMVKIWNAQPLHTEIVEFLQKKRGATIDVELYNTLKKKNNDLSFRLFNKTLMKLEIEGIIHVASLTKNKRHIELTKKN